MSQQSRPPSPWENCNGDHEILDIEVINEKGHVIERPYLTLFIDPVTRRVLDYQLETEAFPPDDDHRADE